MLRLRRRESSLAIDCACRKQTAQTLKQRSDKAAAGKEFGQAIELATKAWESVQTFPKDATCREMSGDLQRRMDELGRWPTSSVALI